MAEDNDTYGLPTDAGVKEIPAPDLPYQPRKPKSTNPPIAIVGCGGISASHLGAYQRNGLNVVAMCDVSEEAANKRREEFFPNAKVYTDHRKLLEETEAEVIDAATHPAIRAEVIPDALEAGKHVLSQKPFVLDLDLGEKFIALAKEKNLKLAVNQNGRWAPYFSYLRQLVSAGLLGEIRSIDMHSRWDHTWIRGTKFEGMRHVILYDYANHWIDIVAQVFAGQQADKVYAAVANVAGQTMAPPMSAFTTIEYPNALATMVFHSHTELGGSMEQLVVTGTKGTFYSNGATCGANNVYLYLEDGMARPKLEGEWFKEGFAGTMLELLCAIEEGRDPVNSAESVMPSLALNFAALESTRTGAPVKPGDAKLAGDGCTA